MANLRTQQDGGLARQVPAAVGAERRRPTAAVANRFAAPGDRPAVAERRRQQRFRADRRIEVAPEIHEEESIAALAAEEAQDERARSDDGAVRAAPPGLANHRVGGAQLQ